MGNWDNGDVKTLKKGETATCDALNTNELYALVFYNTAQHNTTTDVTVSWSNKGEDTAQIKVPGTTANKGLGYVAFLWGGDSSLSVSATVENSQHNNSSIDAFIASGGMPTNWNSIELKPGDRKEFQKRTRFYAVPASHKHVVTIEAGISQFIVLRMKTAVAKIFVAKATGEDPGIFTYLGTGAKTRVTSASTTKPTLPEYFTGNGQQSVWISPSSVQDIKNCYISLTSLAGNENSPEATEHDFPVDE